VPTYNADMNEKNQALLKLLLSHIILPGLLLTGSIIFKKINILLTLMTQTFLIIILLSGYWEFFGQKFKWIFFSFMQILIILNIIYIFSAGVHSEVLNPVSVFLIVIELWLLILLIRIITVIFYHAGDFVGIYFPFRHGVYLITDGGNSRISRLMNYHFHSAIHRKKNTNRSMLYATDIVKTAKGKRKMFPLKNEDYPVFGGNVYCPMEGTVFKTIDNIDDNEPFSGNYPYNTGNTVVVKNKNLYFLLGHLQNGSISVKEGEYVKEGDILAKAGNSGMTERPHIHIQLMRSENENYWKGEGVSIRFRNRNLYKNRIVKVN
jgi:hypothetical protein